MMGETVTHWKGRLIDELSREELLEVVAYSARRLSELTTPGMIRAQAIGRAEMMKRGEKA